MRAAPALCLAVLLGGCLGGGGPSSTSSGLTPAEAAAPHVVVAHLDTGINPYHAAFRWDSALAWQHPSTYLPGYPADAERLDLTLDAPSYEEAVKADAKVWDGVKAGTLYWIPGTKIVGAISLGAGGTYCPTVQVPPLNQLDPTGPCTEHRILDDFGHGTMTASRMAGDAHSLDPEGLIVSVEGPGQDAVDWVAKSGLIDVVSNSWGELTPTATSQELARHIRDASAHNLWLFASGNGVGFLNGVVGQPTEVSPTFPPGVVIVGAHDNGYATTWHGAPPHVIADGFGGWRANARNSTEWAPSPQSCCTSAAAPYAAGGAAAILLEARKVLWDGATGVRLSGDDQVPVVAVAPPGCGEPRLRPETNATSSSPKPRADAATDASCPPLPATGPLSDGVLTLDELKALLKATARPRPPVRNETSDDGLVNWAGTPGATPQNPWPGDNPYCVGCFTSPVALADVPGDVSLVSSIGYGAVDMDSVVLAAEVLHGLLPAPPRSTEDAFFAADEQARDALYP